jgi:hypothetical protein
MSKDKNRITGGGAINRRRIGFDLGFERAPVQTTEIHLLNPRRRRLSGHADLRWGEGQKIEDANNEDGESNSHNPSTPLLP